MKKISTKLNISMLACAMLVLAFVGSMTVVNMSIDYRRDFERTAERVLESGSIKDSKDIEATVSYLESALPLFSESCDYYILEGGNIVRSSKQGGMLTMTQELAAALGTKAEGNGSALDRAVNAGGYTVYIIDDKTELRSNILDISFLFLQALVFGTVLAAIISFFISKRLTRSIKELESGAKRMSEGEFTEIAVRSEDEIGSLCRVFNDMGRQIQNDYDEFERAESSRREFVANVSHELKTPLTVIKSYSETLANAQVDEQTRSRFLHVIDTEVDRMTGIVGQLLQLSRLETPIGTPQSQETDLSELCRQITDSLAIQAAKKELRFVFSGEGRAVTDREKVKTVLTNVLSNAVKYSKEKEDIEIMISKNGVSVKNRGIPISSEDLPHIFERFYRTDKARNRETGGTGLGLAIAKESAQAIGASLTAHSFGEITEFVLEL